MNQGYKCSYLVTKVYDYEIFSCVQLSAFRPIDASKSYAGIHLIDNQTNQPKDSDNQEDKPKDPEQAKRTTSNTKWKASVTVSQTRRKKNN